MMKARRLDLGFGRAPLMTRDNFLVASNNAEAVEAVDRWPRWNHQALLLCGPASSGKTHLLTIWREKAAIASPLSDSQMQLQALREGKAAVIDDADRLAKRDEEAFFHALNSALAEKTPLLLSARAAPGRWVLGLPDLASRVKALPSIMIGWPDEDFMHLFFVKLFADKERVLPANVIAYLVKRVGRTPDAMRDIADRLEARAEEEMRPITLSLARQILEKL